MDCTGNGSAEALAGKPESVTSDGCMEFPLLQHLARQASCPRDPENLFS